VAPLLRLVPLARLPRRAAGAPLLPAPALVRAARRGRLWRIAGHRHVDPFGDGPDPFFVLALDGPGASLWQAVSHDVGRRRSLRPRGGFGDGPALPARRCTALVRLLARILGPEGPRLRRRQVALLLDIACATGSEDACVVAGRRPALGTGILRHRPCPAEDVLLLDVPRRTIPLSALPPALARLLRADPGEIADDYGLAPQIFLSARPADRSAHARLAARDRLRRRHGQGVLDALKAR